MVDLITSQSYLDATPEQRKPVVNGCGPQGFWGRFVPNTIWFMNIKESCKRHDWDYEKGETEEDKIIADDTFLKNMEIQIDNAGGFGWLKRLRRRRAKFYYHKVVESGDSSFWRNKDVT